MPVTNRPMKRGHWETEDGARVRTEEGREQYENK